MRNCENHLPALPVAAIAASVLAWDLTQENTVSEWLRDRAHEHKALAVGVVALSAYHVLRPEGYPFDRIDPITQVGTAIRRLTV